MMLVKANITIIAVFLILNILHITQTYQPTKHLITIQNIQAITYQKLALQNLIIA